MFIRGLGTREKGAREEKTRKPAAQRQTSGKHRRERERERGLTARRDRKYHSVGIILMVVRFVGVLGRSRQCRRACTDSMLTPLVSARLRGMLPAAHAL